MALLTLALTHPNVPLHANNPSSGCCHDQKLSNQSGQEMFSLPSFSWEICMCISTTDMEARCACLTKKKTLLRLNMKKNFLKITRLTEENPGLNINLIKLPAWEGFSPKKTQPWTKLHPENKVGVRDHLKRSGKRLACFGSFWLSEFWCDAFILYSCWWKVSERRH